MTCCVDDIQFAGLIAVWDDAQTLEHGEWYTITCQVKMEYDEGYDGEGPVLRCTKVERAEEANPEVATF